MSFGTKSAYFVPNQWSEYGVFLAEYGADEVVYAGIDDVVAVSVFGRHGIRCAFELGIEACGAGVEEGLFLRGEGSLVLECVDELLREVRGRAEGVLVSRLFACSRVGLVVPRVWFEDLQPSFPGDITVVVVEVFLADSESVLRVQGSDNLVDRRIMVYSCHISPIISY